MTGKKLILGAEIEIDFEDLAVRGSIKEICEEIKTHLQHKLKFSELSFPIKHCKYQIAGRTDYGYYGAPDRNHLVLEIHRPETDEEYEKRLQVERKYEEKRKKAAETTKKVQETKRKKKEALEQNPDYQNYKELQQQLKKKKLI